MAYHVGLFVAGMVTGATIGMGLMCMLFVASKSDGSTG